MLVPHRWGTDWDTFMKLKWNEIGPEGGSSDSIFDSPGWGCNFGLQGEVLTLQLCRTCPMQSCTTQDTLVLPEKDTLVLLQILLYYLKYSCTT